MGSSSKEEGRFLIPLENDYPGKKGGAMEGDGGITGSPWTRAEVEATVADYFRMLRMQEMGQRPNKAQHTRRLHELIPARNVQAIEYKHRNISAVLNLYGAQTLNGYKPLPNFQRLLIEVVGEALMRDHTLDHIAIRSVETPAEAPALNDFHDFVVKAPAPKAIGKTREDVFLRLPVKRDYLEREARNRSLGLAGELLVMEYEARRLRDLNERKLADRIEHTSKIRGDGAGFDILSFDKGGRERFIEVKTTAYVAETPFFVTPNEVTFSNEKASQFHLYRLFAFRQKPRMFALSGPVSENFRLDPASFRATLLGNSKA